MAVESLEDIKAFARAVAVIDDTSEDADVARYVASALHGIAKGFDDAGAHASAGALRFAGAELVRQLSSGAWRQA